MPRVVISGMGLISPLANNVEEFWKKLLAGQSSIGPLTGIDASPFEKKTASEVKNKDDLKAVSRHPSAGRACHYAIEATEMALRDAGLFGQIPKNNEIGVMIGTTLGNQDVEERLADESNSKTIEEMNVDPERMSHFKSSRLGFSVAQEFGLGGMNLTIPTACAAGNYAIGIAARKIQKGEASIILAGGADPFTRACYTIFHRLGAITPGLCKPFDEFREGMVVGEGAAILVLEEYDSAKKRGAPIYCEVLSYGLACDAYHPTAPHPEGLGAISAMQSALAASGLTPEKINYISAHGTGTKANDVCESIAMAKVFGENLKAIPVSSIKSSIGHCMGAASAIEACVCALAIRDQVLPPTMSTQKLDPTFPVSFDHIPIARPAKIDFTMSNAFAFGGNTSSLIFGISGCSSKQQAGVS